MKIKESEKKNYDEEYIITTIMRDLKQIEEDVKEYGAIRNSTIQSAKFLLGNLVFFKETVLEEE